MLRLVARRGLRTSSSSSSRASVTAAVVPRAGFYAAAKGGNNNSGKKGASKDIDFSDPRVAALQEELRSKGMDPQELGRRLAGSQIGTGSDGEKAAQKAAQQFASGEFAHTRYPPLRHAYRGGFDVNRADEDDEFDFDDEDVDQETEIMGQKIRGGKPIEEPPFQKILIANRGEIACRVIRTAKAMGIKTVAVHSEADTHSKHVAMADEAVCIGTALSKDSYLLMDRIIEACKMTGAQAVHPGYGFLSENTKFAAALQKAGIVFLGPPSDAIFAMGDKIESKKLAQKAGVHIIPGRLAEITTNEEVVAIAKEIGYPIMIKASAGGGGKGMRMANNDQEAIEGFRFAKQEAMASFGDERILIEKFVDEPRHVEIQVIADGHGNVVYLNERECSIQRRNQKVLEEAPSPFMTPAKRKEMGEQACALARAVGYQSAGTVEFLMDSKRNFYFLEMNTRLQVEHPVTEKITGVDIVEQMIRVGAGKPLDFKQSDIGIDGWAMEARVYAEDPARNFLPSIGHLTRYVEPMQDDDDVRCDSGIRVGDEVRMFYDPMICKLVAWGPNRAASMAKLSDALDRYQIRGVNHNIPFLRACMDNPRYASGNITTKFIQEEFPNGFQGARYTTRDKGDLVATAAAQHWLRVLRTRGMAHAIHEVKTDTRDGPSIEDGAEFVVRVHNDYPTEENPAEVNTQVTIVPMDSQQLQELLDADVESMTPAQREFVEKLQGEAFGQTFYYCVMVNDLGEREEVILDISRWSVGENMMEVTIISMNEEGADVCTRVMQVDVANKDAQYHIVLKGTKNLVRVLTSDEADLLETLPAPVSEKSAKLLRSPMPGALIEVVVKPGDKVVMGQEICVIEAMKLQNVLRAEADGIVKAVHVAAGKDVDLDQLIVEFE